MASVRLRLLLLLVVPALSLPPAPAQALVLAAREPAPGPRCPPDAPKRCQKGEGTGAANEYFFKVDDLNLMYSYSDGNYLTLKCPKEGIALDDPALPRFETKLVVRHVNLECPLPAASYEAVLRNINVAPPSKLTLRGGRLRRDQLAGSAHLRTLDLITVDVELSALAAATDLTNLYMEKVNLTAADLERLPATLTGLHLRQTGVGLVSAAALKRLPALASLVVRGDPFVRVQTDAASSLRSLIVTSASARLDPRLPPSLENVTVDGWTANPAEPWVACAGLVHLKLDGSDVTELPGGWVERCGALRHLQVKRAPRLARLANDTLRGARALRRLQLTHCALRTLPPGLLADAPDLRELDLSNNNLHALPPGLLADAPDLRELDLSNNNLHALPSGIFRNSKSLAMLRLSTNLFDGSVLKSLEAVSSLDTLYLNDNEALDACPAPDITDDTLHVPLTPPSALRNLAKLKWLILDGTRTSRVCSDWRELRQLQALGLRRTAVTALTYNDLRFTSKSAVTLTLCGANVTRLEFERKEYDKVIEPDAALVTVRLGATLRRDCSLYWAAAALRREGARVRHERCGGGGGGALAAVPLDELVCELPCSVVAGCACAVRDDVAAPEPLLRLQCAGAGLERVPRVNVSAALGAALDAPPAARYRIDLRLADNRIAGLHPDDLPPDLVALDLRNNSLKLIDAATASTLISRPELRVRLAGNEIECGCDALAVLGAVRTRPDVFADRAEATCASGLALAVAAADPPCAEPGPAPAALWALAGLAALAPAGLAALALLRPELRLRLKKALRARGLWPRAAERDDGRRYDAFVSFAHSDEGVVRELAARLEGGAAPLRLCLHYRDWAPGGWIPAQIAASVRESRRTVAVVSAHFLRSAWARAEFREAHAAALRDAEPRLVVVLLDEPARLPLDAELRAYLAANTYVRWGDPWFWDKLRRALPAPRAAPPAPPAPPAPASPAAA